MTHTLTAHARDAMQRRGIQADWLERALLRPQRREPDALDADLEHRLLAIPEFGNRVLHVIVNVGAHPERVVTAFFDRRLRGDR